jgi:hypothetical protein
MGRRILAVGLTAACIVANLAYAAPPGERAPLRVARAQVKESLNPTLISDVRYAIYGLVPDQPDLRVRIPPPSQGDPTVFIDGLGAKAERLCVAIQRAQGGYSADFDATVPPGRGVAQVAFDSRPKVREVLQRHQPTALELGIRVSERTKRGCDPLAPLLPAGWSVDNLQGNYLLLVGAAAIGKPSVRLPREDLRTCTLISERLKRADLGAGAYAYACPVRLDGQNCGRQVPLTVVWFKGSRAVNDVTINARAPCRAARS